MLSLALLALTLAQTPEPEQRDLTFGLELTGGGKQLGANLMVDYGLVPDVLFLNAGYSLIKPPNLAATADTPAVPTSFTHALAGGVDWSPTHHLTLSALFTGSPKATDSIVINPGAKLEINKVTVSTSHSSVGGTLMAAWLSAGDSHLEWVLDGGGGATANRLGRAVKLGGVTTSEDDPLVALRAQLGLTLTVFDDTDVSLRGSYTGYTADPLVAGRFNAADLQRIGMNAGRFAVDLAAVSRAAQVAATRLGQVDSLSGYASAPIWVESKLSVLHRFNRTVSAQLAWTFDRYVPTAGHSNVLAAKVTVRLGGGWRLWAAGALQLDQPLDHPEQVAPDEALPLVSGQGTLGAELTL